MTDSNKSLGVDMNRDTKNPNAFPYSGVGDDANYSKGMTLRDYFAAKAMQGLLSNPKLHQHIIKEGGAYGGWLEHSAYGWQTQ
jgi:hypothetical protein